MKKKIIVNVTARDIKKGCKADGENCPIYRAAKRLKGLTVSWVYPSRIQFTTATVMLPNSAVNFIKDFDVGKAVSPLKFTIEV